MGGKQWKNRKHFLFYGACFLIIILMTEGCILPARRVQVLPEGVTPVERASMMVSEGDYDGALKEFSKIARSYPGEYPGDRALFEMGLIWTYPGNPKKDYEEALKYFNRLLHDFPGSQLREEAGAWAEALSKLTGCNDGIKALEDEIISYKKQIISYKEQISALKEIDIGIEEKKRKGLPGE